MKPKLRWLLLLVPLALFAWAYQAASWRPKLVGTQPIFAGNGLKPMQYGPGARLLVSPDGEHLASSGVANKSSFVMLWNIAARKAQWRIDDEFYNGGMGVLAFSPDGRTLAVSADEGSFGRSNYVIYFVQTATGKRHRLMQISWQTRLQDAAFLSDRELVVATSQDVSIVDTQTGVIERQWKPKLPTPPAQKLAAPGEIRISADGTTVLASYERTSNTVVAIYDGATGGQRGQWTFKGVFRNPRLSPDGKLWAMTRPDKQSVFGDVYDATNGQKLWGPMLSSPGSPWIWSADGQKFIFQTTLGKSVWSVDARTAGHAKSVANSPNNQALALAPNGDTLYTLDNTGKIWRWRAR